MKPWSFKYCGRIWTSAKNTKEERTTLRGVAAILRRWSKKKIDTTHVTFLTLQIQKKKQSRRKRFTLGMWQFFRRLEMMYPVRPISYFLVFRLQLTISKAPFKPILDILHFVQQTPMPRGLMCVPNSPPLYLFLQRKSPRCTWLDNVVLKTVP